MHTNIGVALQTNFYEFLVVDTPTLRDTLNPIKCLYLFIN